MVGFKYTCLITLLSILSINSKCINNNDKAVATTVQCNSNFGRVINVDGKNTYSYTCKCTASNYNTSVENDCSYTGDSPKFECASTSEKTSADGQISLNIAKCASESTSVDIKAKQESKKASFPLQCKGVGTSGLECKGSTTVL